MRIKIKKLNQTILKLKNNLKELLNKPLKPLNYNCLMVFFIV